MKIKANIERYFFLFGLIDRNRLLAAMKLKHEGPTMDMCRHVLLERGEDAVGDSSTWSHRGTDNIYSNIERPEMY